MNTEVRLVAVLGLLLSLAWTATAQTIDNESNDAALRLLSQSTRSGEREVIHEIPRQGWLGER